MLEGPGKLSKTSRQRYVQLGVPETPPNYRGMRAQRKAPSTPSTLKCSHVEGGLTTNKLANDPHIICRVTYPNVLLA